MKRSSLVLTGAIALSVIGLSAHAGGNAELLEVCKDYEAKYGGAADCACVAEKAEGVALAELLKVNKPEDIDGISEETKAVLNACPKE